MTVTSSPMPELVGTVLDKKIISVRDLLSDPDLNIPPYQRPYKWTGKNIQQLFSDIAIHKNKSSYRLGTVVFHRNGAQKDIVDGQQRTISLRLTVRALIEFRMASLVRKDLKEQLAELGTSMFTPSFKSEISKLNLRDNYLEISRIVSRTEFSEEHIDFLLNGCKVVTFTLNELTEAFQFFDSQNARGRDLDPHDLLKAYHLREFAETDQDLKARTVARWESSESNELVTLFARYLYRIRNWSRGGSARYFGKDDVHLFKGVNIETVAPYPYVEQLHITHRFVDNYNRQYERAIDGHTIKFPFRLDQIVINGRRFFEMTAHYQDVVSHIGCCTKVSLESLHKGALKGNAGSILDTLNDYDGRFRTGDRYIRTIFDCLLIYYLDKFGNVELSPAIERIFIWAYSLRLKMKAVQLATIDNHVLENNLFRVIKDAIRPEDFLCYIPPEIGKVNSSKTDKIEALFREMKYL